MCGQIYISVHTFWNQDTWRELTDNPTALAVGPKTLDI